MRLAVPIIWVHRAAKFGGITVERFEPLTCFDAIHHRGNTRRITQEYVGPTKLYPDRRQRGSECTLALADPYARVDVRCQT